VQLAEDGCTGRGEAQGVFYLSETAESLFAQVNAYATIDNRDQEDHPGSSSADATTQPEDNQPLVLRDDLNCRSHCNDQQQEDCAD
jgi:hypothetical protein